MAVDRAVSTGIVSGLVIFACALQIFTQSKPTAVEITVRESKTVAVKITSAAYDQSISFADDYAGISGLSRRIASVEMTDVDVKPLSFHSPAAGTYVAERPIGGLVYNVDLTPTSDPATRAHVSSIDDDMGVLMLADLLPKTGIRSVSIRVSLPSGWTHSGLDLFDSLNIDKSIIVIGKQLRQISEALGDGSLKFVISGEWQFTDDQVREVTREVVTNYRKLFGSQPRPDVRVVFIKLRDVPPGAWKAETRGRNIVIASSDMPFKSQAVQRLHEQLRHEIFHLWIPNGLNLSGNYDWFYEGFALYQSLRLGVEENRIRFEDFLDTLSRAAYISNETHRPVSLIDASNQRWAGNATQVYTRGMVVAFLCDVAMLDASRGKLGITEMLRDLYRENRGTVVSADAKTVVLAKIRSYRELTPIIERYVTGTDAFSLIDFLGHAGLRLEVMRPYSRLVVDKELSGRQKVVLDRMGYNSWRRISQQKK